MWRAHCLQTWLVRTVERAAPLAHLHRDRAHAFADRWNSTLMAWIEAGIAIYAMCVWDVSQAFWRECFGSKRLFAGWNSG